MNLNKYTEKAQEAILAAQQSGERAGHPEVMPEHLLVALVDQQDGIVPALLGKMNVDPARVRTETQALLAKLPQAHGGAAPGLSSRLRSVLNAAEDEAARLKDEFTSTEHLFLALVARRGPCPVRRAVQAARHHQGHAVRRPSPPFAARSA